MSEMMCAPDAFELTLISVGASVCGLLLGVILASTTIFLVRKAFR